MFQVLLRARARAGSWRFENPPAHLVLHESAAASADPVGGVLASAFRRRWAEAAVGDSQPLRRYRGNLVGLTGSGTILSGASTAGGCGSVRDTCCRGRARVGRGRAGACGGIGCDARGVLRLGGKQRSPRLSSGEQEALSARHKLLNCKRHRRDALHRQQQHPSPRRRPAAVQSPTSFGVPRRVSDRDTLHSRQRPGLWFIC